MSTPIPCKNCGRFLGKLHEGCAEFKCPNCGHMSLYRVCDIRVYNKTRAYEQVSPLTTNSKD